MTAISNGLQGFGHLAMVSHGLVHRVAPGEEFFNITTGCERQVAITAQNHAPDILVCRKRNQSHSKAFPHGEVDRIELAGIGQGNRRNGTLAGTGNRTGHYSEAVCT